MRKCVLLPWFILLTAGLLAGCRNGDLSQDDPGARLLWSTRREVLGSEPGRPFSSAVRISRFCTRNGVAETIGQTLYVSGQVGINPASGEPVRGDVKTETRQVMENLKNAVEAAGFSLADAVQCTVFLSDMGDYQAMNEAYLEYFPEAAPSRACVGVRELVRGLRVEISLVAEK